MNSSPRPALRAQQEALLDALFFPAGWGGDASPSPWSSHPQNHRGMQAYQANGHAMSERSLRAAYPVIEMMVGSTSFNAIAKDLWHRHPPERGDLTQWGGALPAFLEGCEQLAAEPYLADVARVEWAVHCAASAADVEPDLASFARLSSEDPDTLSLAFAPGVSAVNSRFPVASLVLAHLGTEPSLAAVSKRLHQGQGETAMVWRQGLKPCLAPCSQAAAALVAQLLSGQNLSSALDAALCAPQATDAGPFDFSQWLTEAVTQGLVIGTTDAQRLPTGPI